MSINNKLITFAQQELVLAHNDKERDKIKASLNELQRKLENKFGDDIDEFVLFGSYTRNTILPREYDSESDIDLMVVFNTGFTPGTYRKNLHDLLVKAYPNSVSKKDFPVVKLELYHTMFDIVPAYAVESSWTNNVTYYIPDLSDGWRVTIPNDLNETLSVKNKSYGNNIVRNVIRLCKHWNAASGYRFQSYEMEKWILNRFFISGDTLYEKFLSVLNDMAGTESGVRQALDHIKKYKGDFFTEANEDKQFQWLKKLLPGLK